MDVVKACASSTAFGRGARRDGRGSRILHRWREVADDRSGREHDREQLTCRIGTVELGNVGESRVGDHVRGSDVEISRPELYNRVYRDEDYDTGEI